MDENCAGYILKALAAVVPAWSDLADLPVYVHPMDVLKTLVNKNRLHAPLLAPSHYQKLDQKYADLSTDDKKLFFEVLDHPVALNDASSKHLLDALVEYLSFERYRNSGEIPESIRVWSAPAFLLEQRRGKAALRQK